MDLSDWVARHVDLRELTAPVGETVWPAGDTEGAHNRLERLQRQLPPGVNGNRVALLTYPVCGDLSCGGFTAELQSTENTVTLHELGWDSDIAEGWSTSLYDPPLSLTFDRHQYIDVLRAAQSSLRVG